MRQIYSSPRLHSYTQVLGVDGPQVIYAHHWNSMLSSSFYPILQAFEITLRNAINNAARYSPNSPYKNNNWWFQTIATEVQNRKIRQMRPQTKRKWLNANGVRTSRLGYYEQKINDARQVLGDQARPITASAVFSRQSFGFWVGMLGRDFEARGTQRFLWPHLLTDVFPHAPVNINLNVLRAKADIIRELRNRISHHEPIWKFFHIDPNGNFDYSNPIMGLRPSLKTLRSHYESIMEYIRWMSVESYNELYSANLCQEFEFLCSVEGFKHFMSDSRRSSMQRRIYSNIDKSRHFKN